MRIKRIGISEFRSYATAAAAFGPGVNYVGGQNGVGKTSLADAIRVALTGTCRGAETGMDLGELRRQGSVRRWSVELETDDGQVISRAEGEGPRSNRQKAIDLLVKIPRHQVSACLESGVLLGEDDKAVQKIVLELASPGYEIPADVAALARAHGVDAGERMSLAEIDAAYKLLYERRREEKARSRALTSAAPAVPDGLDESVAALSNEHLDAHVRDVRSRLEALRAQHHEADSRLVRLRGEVLSAQARLQRARAALDNAQPTRQATGDVEDLERRLRVAREAHQAAQRAVTEAISAERAADRARTEARAEVAELRDLSGKTECPTCRQKIPKDVFQRVLDTARDVSEAAVKAHYAAKAAVVDAQRKLAALDHPSLLECELDAARAAAGADVELEAARQAFIAAENEAGNAADALDREGDPLIEQVEQLHARLANGEALLAKLTRYAGARHAAEQAASARAATDQAVEQLEQLVAFFGPEGVRSHASTGGVDQLEGAINAVLRPMGYAVDLAGVVRLAGPLLVNGRPARLLSSSERLRVGLAIQAAIARWTGLGIVVIDDYERLVGPALLATQAAVAHLAADLQVFVLSSVRDVEAFRLQAPAIAERSGWTFLEVESADEGSTITRLAGAQREAA